MKDTKWRLEFKGSEIIKLLFSKHQDLNGAYSGDLGFCTRL